MKKLSIPLMLAIVLSACGFHLKGMIDVPQWLNNVSIIAKNGDKQLVAKLSSQLEGYKIEVNPDPARAQYWLVINNITLQQQIVSIGASTNPRQYQLIMIVEFLLQTPKGQIIKPARKVTVNRQFTANNDRILGSNEEETILINEMQQDAALQIINRLTRK
jgi:LPS-assembly lipoprotein